MLTVATCLWDANAASRDFSQGYDETWVERLYRGFARNLRIFKFVVFTDRPRDFAELGIMQRSLTRDPPDYGSMIEPFAIEGPLLVVGLDTVVTGNLDHLADWAESADRIALPRSPGKPYACNGIALAPRGQTRIFADWRGENDMEWLRAQPHVFTDDLWPGQVVSFKCDVRPNGPEAPLGDARIVYFHGDPKPDALGDVGWVRESWV